MDEKAGKGMQPFPMSGKAAYVGESSRSMYECGKEHQKDRAEESHQVKHWLLEHPDMEDPPMFKFKIVSTFKDPLTRLVSGSRGEDQQF